MKKKILLAEDEEDLRILLSEKLEAAGYEVHAAADGEQALQMAREIKPDLIISDVVMPKMDGNQLYKELRKQDFGRDIPFLVLTARAKMRDYFELMHVDDFLEKPVTGKELVEKVKNALGTEDASPQAVTRKKPGRSDKKDGEIVVNDDIPDYVEKVLDAEMASKSEGVLDLKDKERKKNGKTKKILFVESEVPVYLELQELLHKRGIDSEVVCSAGDCLKKAKEYSPDLIIAKYVLCGIGTDQLIESIRAIDGMAETPVIIYSDIAQIKRDQKKNTTQVIMTPEGLELLRKISEILG